ncbi:MAG: thymidine phosphorylase [Gammaproteobacteria bacterium]|nr:thymidine phosphorylase [Gammaproteobacteria bacterium]
MLPQEVICTKREGNALSAEEITFFIEGMVKGSFSESQVSALVMAVYFQGMNRDECVNLTRALQFSGSTLQWSEMDLNGPVVDKHSTGGVGDKVSIMLAPMLVACGVHVPMISGRGLGHTGGTLDKMDSIAGYNTSPSIEDFQRIVATTGCAIVGQTAELAPADKQLYGIRDVTGTVESIPMITASILSKKLSAGLDSLVMDVKVGTGSFNVSYDIAKALAVNLVEVGDGFGLPISAVITDMNQVLGNTAGNALEIIETLDYLTGEYREPRLHEVIVELGAELLLLSGVAVNIGSARLKMSDSLTSGLAAEIFARMVTDLGGPSDLLEKRDLYLQAAPIVVPVFINKEHSNIKSTMQVETVNGRALGNAVVALGGGRVKAQDAVDHSVGLSAIKGIGESVDDNEPLLFVHAKNQTDADIAIERIHEAFTYCESVDVAKSAIIDKVNTQNL